MKDIGLILGIRPDVIRASKIIKLLNNSSEIDFDFIWSGQHYSENMKDVFFNQLNVPVPDYEFNIDITTGISAPPIGIINKKPIKNDTTNNIQNKFEDCVEQSR